MKRLFGGHRNRVYRINGLVKVVWKDGFERIKKIRDGVLLENFVAAHSDIKSRVLVDKSKPIQEEKEGLVTYFHYVEGEIRYPWNPAEIASAAELLGRLHKVISSNIHLDFARGNILFKPNTSTAIGVIDFETTAVGPVEQELGRTLSFLLVDTPIPSSLFLLPSSFASRRDALLTNYQFLYRKDDVLEWTIKYLRNEDYGNLNKVRDMAAIWLDKLKT